MNFTRKNKNSIIHVVWFCCSKWKNVTTLKEDPCFLPLRYGTRFIEFWSDNVSFFMTVLLCLPLPNNVQIKIPPKLNWDLSLHSSTLWYKQSWYISCPVFIALFSPLLLLFNPNKVCKLSYHAFSDVFSLHLALLLFICSAGRLLFWQIFMNSYKSEYQRRLIRL